MLRFDRRGLARSLEAQHVPRPYVSCDRQKLESRCRRGAIDRAFAWYGSLYVLVRSAAHQELIEGRDALAALRLEWNAPITKSILVELVISG